MKKSTLALSMAAAIATFGFLGSASAIGVLENNPTTGVGAGGDGGGVVGTYAASSSTLGLATDGIGHQLVVPYFTAQAGNVTMVNLTNNDIANGKLVKVRFRGAANSDDILDFQILMSPGDMWSGVVTQDPVTGLSNLKTTDTTCTLPDTIRTSTTGTSFIASRTDPTPFLGTAANQTREGYIEIINMADIPKPKVGVSSVFSTGGATGNNDIGTSSTLGAYGAMTAAQQAATLYGTTKHSSGVAACAPAVLSATLGSDFTTYKLANAAGLDAPTGGLSANWIILNQTNTAAWSGAATALKASGPGNLAYWPQKAGTPATTATTLTPAVAVVVTADPLFTTSVVSIQNYDLPDLSTQYDTTATAAGQADATSALIAVKSISNEFLTGNGIAAVTDMIFTQPTRRYSVAVNYAAAGTTASNTSDLLTTGTRAAPVYRDQTSTTALTTYVGTGSNTHGKNNTSLVNRQVCLDSIPSPSYFNREEGVVLGQFVSSPLKVASFSLCGEAAVASFNMAGVTNGSALNATVVRNDIPLAYNEGFVTFDTTNAKGVNGTAILSNVGSGTAPFVALPILGSSNMRVANGAVNYGFTMSNKVTR